MYLIKLIYVHKYVTLFVQLEFLSALFSRNFFSYIFSSFNIELKDFPDFFSFINRQIFYFFFSILIVHEPYPSSQVIGLPQKIGLFCSHFQKFIGYLENVQIYIFSYIEYILRLRQNACNKNIREFKFLQCVIVKQQKIKKKTLY